jgi:hypothetical protein
VVTVIEALGTRGRGAGARGTYTGTGQSEEAGEEHCSACGQLIVAQLTHPMAPSIDAMPVEDRATNQPTQAPLSPKREVTP